MNKKIKIVARLTILMKGSTTRLIAEVHSDASFHKFYKWYSQDGRKRKKFLRTSQRNDGLNFTRAQGASGLDVLAARQLSFNKTIEGVVIKIFQKRMYSQLLTCAPNALGSGLPTANSQNIRAQIALKIPATYTPLQKRMDILTGAK